MSFDFQESTNRRDILKWSAASLATSAVAPVFGAENEKLPWEICTFTKPLQPLSYEEMAKTLAEIGFDGIEGTVRPGGHVVPEKVEDDLPKLVAALKEQDLNFTLMTSGINEVSEEQRTEAVLRTAAENGVKRFRMSYYPYDLSKPILPQLDEFRAQLRDLIALTDELGIKPIYQNHSGEKYFGAPIWDLVDVFGEFTPDQVGVAFDIGHATVEGAKAWPLNFAVIKDYLDTVYVKEPSWTDNKIGWGALGEGAVDEGFYKLLKDSDFSGPISLHVEYLGHDDPEKVPAILDAIRKDFATLKGLLS